MLIRKLLRTAWSYKAQFISMIIMITLGMGVFLGFNMEWATIEYDTGKQDKAQLMESFDSFVQIMDSMVFILVIAAVILGIYRISEAVYLRNIDSFRVFMVFYAYGLIVPYNKRYRLVKYVCKPDYDSRTKHKKQPSAQLSLIQLVASAQYRRT